MEEYLVEPVPQPRRAAVGGSADGFVRRRYPGRGPCSHAGAAQGPFYPLQLPAEQDADLAAVAGKPARGEPIVVTGRILRRDGTPVGNAQVEIWQTNAYGRYHHEHDDSPAPCDPGFQGWGRDPYRRRGPVPLPQRASRSPTAGAHRISTSPSPPPAAAPFYTQLYLADAAENGRDLLYARLSQAEQAQLAGAPRIRGGRPAHGALRYRPAVRRGRCGARLR
ncbi:MAG: hypothetical protein MZW92_14935 [Comamonadaceae bacterium]|nr:hypothetical protein [Comamonadaceae bacterium]